MRIDSKDMAELSALRLIRDVTDGILSVYLPIDPAVALHHGHIPLLMDVLRLARESAPEDQRARIEEEAEKVLVYAREEYTPTGSALIIFCSTPAEIWHTISLQIKVPPIARFGPLPFLAPLDAVIDDLPTTTVALVDHQEARLIGLVLGELEGSMRVQSPVPGRQRQGGWTSSKYDRDRRRHIHTHLQDVASALAEFQEAHLSQRVILAGTDETTHELADLLPGALKEQLAGTMRSEMFATDSQVAEMALAVLEEAERARERELTRGLIDTALAKGKASIGEESTLDALAAGRVHQLLLSEAAYYTQTGEQAAARAWDTGASIELVHGDAATLLSIHDGIGAILRY